MWVGWPIVPLRGQPCPELGCAGGTTFDVAHNGPMVFDYLTVLISVVIGLSVTSFLTNIVRIIHVRSDVTVSWVQLLWSVVILIWTVAFWWFTFVLAEETQWTFRLFIFLLAYSTLLFFLMALLFPEGMPSDHNYRAQFMRNRVWFFSVFLLFLSLDLLDYWIKLEKDVSIVSNLQYAAFVGPLIVLSLIALRTANLLFHRAFATYALLAVLAMSVDTLSPLAS